MGLIFGLSFFNMSAPGGMVPIYLAGALTCLLPIGFSGGWPKYTGIIFCVVFLYFADLDAIQGNAWKRQIRVKTSIQLQTDQPPDARSSK